MGKQRIRFIDTSYKTLFLIDDGEDIEVEIEGEWKRYACKYLDDNHVEIAGHCFHIHEFAMRLKKASQRYRPVEKQANGGM